nr:CPBP family intramembrane glutamic endopeptidase [Corynebacterium lactis]
MTGTPATDTETDDRAGAKRHWVQHPLMRLLYFFVLFALLTLILRLPLPPLASGPDGQPTPTEVSIGMVPVLVAVVAAYYLTVRLAEKRRVTELTRGAVVGAVVGLIAGAALLSVVVGLVWLLGGLSFDGTSYPENWPNVLFQMGVFAGVFEEIVTRGALFRLAEELIGSWGAVILSGALFGAAHAGNTNATLASVVSIAVSAGLLFPIVYMLTRNLWICIGIHVAWNAMQGIVYGIPVSGNDSSGLLVTHATGPELISGGAFGVEASIIVPIVLIAASVFLGIRARREGTVVAPYWRRGATFATAARLRA